MVMQSTVPGIKSIFIKRYIDKYEMQFYHFSDLVLFCYLRKTGMT